MTELNETLSTVTEPPRPSKNACSPASSRKLAWTLGCLAAFAPFAIDMYLPAFPRIAGDLGTSIASVQFTLAVFLLGLAGGQSNRWLLRRFSPEHLLRKSMWITVCAALLLVGCARTGFGGFPLFFGILFLCLATLGIIFPNATAITMQPFKAEAGSASALLGILQYIIGASGGALVGVFHNGTALPMAIQIACYGLAARAILLLTPREKEQV